ncbi:MAG: hypothetical protein HYZ42_08035 [Bacteroidetes bacterium]|nr:hypothetical protein [Bacteroidota bacterium]
MNKFSSFLIWVASSMLLVGLLFYDNHIVKPTKKQVNYQYKQPFELPSRADIDEIIKVLIKEVCPGKVKSNSPLYKELGLKEKYDSGYPIGTSLEKVNLIIQSRHLGDPMRFAMNGRELDQFLNDTINGYPFFNNDDILFLLYQQHQLDYYGLDTSILNSMDTLNIMSIYNLARSHQHIPTFTSFSIPFFNIEKSRAYVVFTHFQEGLGYYLIKVKGHWKVVSCKRRWIA